jgi:hypothetical protein
LFEIVQGDEDFETFCSLATATTDKISILSHLSLFIYYSVVLVSVPKVENG